MPIGFVRKKQVACSCIAVALQVFQVHGAGNREAENGVLRIDGMAAWNSYSKKVQFEKGVNVMEAFSLLPDPQTNGGLLVAVEAVAAEQVKNLFQKHGLQQHLEPIGTCMERGEKIIVVG